jgi:hypothetical protein
MTVTAGTSHFVSLSAAVDYYRPYIGGAPRFGPGRYKADVCANWVQEKLESGEIHIGPPPLSPGEWLLVDRKEGRYRIASEHPGPPPPPTPAIEHSHSSHL